MGGKFSNDDDVIADINITPFVDIVLVVLIIFMVTASLDEPIKDSIKVTLPDAASAEETKSISLGLTLLASGEMLLDGVSVTETALRKALQQARRDAPTPEDVVCLISAEKSVAHGRVVWLIDLVKSEPIAKFAININKVDAIGPDPASLGEGSVPVPAVPVPATP